jgi:tetratricopeptide (TPR) repeat protein
VTVNRQDETLNRIRNAFRLFCRGERTEARGLLTEIWDELGSQGNFFHRCVAAHYLADTAEDPQVELEWDLRALEIARSLNDESAETYPLAAAVRTFLPSLYLNLADDYRRIGDFEKARQHADLGIELSRGLGLDAYGQTIRAGLMRVDTQIEERDSGPQIIFD